MADCATLVRETKKIGKATILALVPNLKTSKYFNKGDLFISCKNISTVFLYRPTTNRILKVIEGPFQSQHDIDIINDSTISIFNNNTHTKWQKTKDTSKNEKNLKFQKSPNLNIGEVIKTSTIEETKVKKNMGPIEVDVKSNMIMDTKSDESSVKLDEKIKGKVKTQKDKLKKLRG